jgi:long-chain acyl-CoA synthetase
MPISNLALLVLESKDDRSKQPALTWNQEDTWTSMTYKELATKAESLACALYDLGIRKGDRVGIWASNQPNWTLLDIAILSLRAVTVPIYATNTLSQAFELVEDSGMKLLFVAGEAPLGSLETLSEHPENLEALILPKGTATPKDSSLPASYLEDLMLTSISAEAAGGIAEIRQDADIHDLATIIYTSGTTGQPKGVMLSHANFLHQHDVVCEYFDVGKGDRSLCFLPLSHVYERSWTWHVLACGAENAYLEDPRLVAQALKDVQPNIMVSVPRLYEKIHAMIHEKLETAPAIRQKLFHWAITLGYQMSALELKGMKPSLGLKVQHGLADKLVLSKIRTALGGEKKFLSAGGAALSAEIESFFHAAGMLVCQGYGLTETSPIVTCNRPGEVRFGSVGKLVPGCELRINSENGEIETRGDNLFKGYWNKPEATDRAFTRDGWFRTGDVGSLGDDGYLQITGRIKELIITSGGKNIAPTRIEAMVARDSYIDQIAAIGDGQKCVAALVVPAFEKLEKWAHARGLSYDCHETLVKMPEVLQLFKDRIRKQSEELGHHEMVKTFALLPEMFTEAAGTLTPTLKLKRHAISARYETLIDSMYDVIEEAGQQLDGALVGIGGTFHSVKI